MHHIPWKVCVFLEWLRTAKDIFPGQGRLLLLCTLIASCWWWVFQVVMLAWATQTLSSFPSRSMSTRCMSRGSWIASRRRETFRIVHVLDEVELEWNQGEGAKTAWLQLQAKPKSITVVQARCQRWSRQMFRGQDMWAYKTVSRLRFLIKVIELHLVSSTTNSWRISAVQGFDALGQCRYTKS